MDKERICNIIDECNDYIDDGGSKFPGMSYEEGVVAALEWALGDEIGRASCRERVSSPV